MNQTKIAIIGAGSVGSAITYALMLKNIPAQITLIDIDTARCKGEILDVSDASGFCHGKNILYGSKKDVAQSDIIIVAAGKKQKKGQKRAALLAANKKIVESIFSKIKLKKTALIIVVTNPVDALTYIVQQTKVLPKNRIIGSGTFLDTQRLKDILSAKLNIAEESIHAYILGEHGPTQFPAWSHANIAGVSIKDFNLSQSFLDKTARDTKNRAEEIIACKGATYYGIATCVAALCRTIVYNQKKVIPVSCYLPKYKVCMSMPVVLGKNGIEQIINLALPEKEQKLLEKSARALRALIK